MPYIYDDPRGYDPYDDDYPIDGVGFADPGSGSALRASTLDKCPACRKRVGLRDDFCKHCSSVLNPRKHSCPECGQKNLLTTIDVRRHYICDRCADRREKGWDTH